MEKTATRAGRKTVRGGHIFQEVAGSNPLREQGVIEVNFTPRTFPTPSRESTRPDEDALEWHHGLAWFVKKDYATVDQCAEMNFSRQGNYQAAINVFSHAIRLNSKLPSLFSNRAACHLKLRNYFKAIEDASKALELLTPLVQQNAASRCKAHVRRGTAFCQLELYVEGLQDYEAALKIDPNNEPLQDDANKIREIIQSSTLT
ncbi:hypothetical protein LSH36_58g16036 [Paralvinella palmiformis]|uniref:Uncharacterized protein n=1 Tax=Paralvinella palmiformis TaxID=53620 RepID=A0AAD9K6F5_9ANNE|nr:hypothetical protein LSH36_58g16036 [Paralvinella palmiformis]